MVRPGDAAAHHRHRAHRRALTRGLLLVASLLLAAGPAFAQSTLWPDTETPTVFNGPDAPVELGVKFRANTTGFVTGIRFYKHAQNVGPHVGNLWSSAGTLLASAPFTNETSSGWQEVTFAQPVPVAANTTYVASYHCPSGFYAFSHNYFAVQLDAPPLQAPPDGSIGGNGVFGYGAASSFPTQSSSATNYWVDLRFTAAPPALLSIEVSPSEPTIASNGSQQFTAIGTFVGGVEEDLTDEVLWESSLPGVAAITAGGLATAVGAGTTQISATADDVSGDTPLTVLAPGQIAIGTATVPHGALGAPYSAPLTVIGGAPPYAWSIVAGALPDGLALGPASGVISGIPTEAGPASFTVQVGSGGQFATRGYSLTIAGNEIAAENALPGSPPSEWDIVGAGDASIQGYATDISVDQGGTVRFKVDTDASNYRIDVYRIGWYGGLGARHVATVEPSVSLPQNQPDCLSDPTTGLVDCGNWAQSATWNVPATAVSGVYVAKLVREDPEDGRASHVVFIVRDDDGGSDVLFQTSDTTWQAYNTYGGNSLYQGQPAGRAYKVSYNRPVVTRCCNFPAGSQHSFFFAAEYPFVRWLERNGYDVSYTTGVDAERRGAEMLEHAVYLTAGHDEYWSGGQRDNVEAARNAGVHLALFTGNAGFWKTRWETSIDGAGTPHRTLVCYKETHANAKIDPLPGAWTGTWRDPRFGPHDGGRPENALNGTIFRVNGIRHDTPEVPAAEGRMRFWRNTDIATLGAGQTAVLPTGTLGFEWDVDADNGFRPPGVVRLSSATIAGLPLLQDFGSSYATGTDTHHLTFYRHASGAIVFSAATVQWSWGLDDQHDFLGTPIDVRMRQATVNLLADMEVQPATLQGGLVPATASSDEDPPGATITAPGSGSGATVGIPLTITGTASDAGGGEVGGVEVTTDGGATWHPAVGRAAWSYEWTPSVAGNAVLRARAVDDSGNLGPNSGIVNVNVALPVLASLEVTPATADVTITLPQQFTALGTFVGGGTQDLTSLVTWSSSDEDVATIDAAGLATTLALGQTTITATLGAISDGASLTVSPPGPLVITSTSLPAGNQLAPYTANLTASGGIPPYVWTLESGLLPTGLSLASNGVISGTPTVTGVVNFTVRVTAGAATVTRLLSITVGPPIQSVWPDSAVPPLFAEADLPSELGVKFRSDIDGYITGVRFYKHALNVGVHVGNLWTIGGALLATAPFVNETPSGWQSVSFAQPVPIDADTTYVVSYHSPNGYYGFSLGLLGAAGIDAPPLHFPAGPGVGGNGVFTYGATSSFPSSSYFDTYYWVDVVFSPEPTAPECSDGFDNDADGFVDFPADPGCANPADLSERAPTLACDDGADNDGDGRSDFDPVTLADPQAGVGDLGCAHANSTREDPACQDGLDNDGQPGIDFDGGASVNGGVPLGPPDPDCAAKPHRNTEAPSCGLGTELAFLLPALRWLRRRRATASS